MGGVEALDVDIGGALGCQLRRLAFEHLAELKQIPVQHGVALDHVLPGIGEMRFESVGDQGPGTVPRRQQALGDQFLDRFPKRWPRHAQVQRQYAL